MGYDYVSPCDTPYCACGVSKSLHDAGVRCPHFPDPVAFDLRNDDLEGRAHDRWDLGFMWPISFDWDRDSKGDHVGFFIEYLDDGLCRTAEYNTGRGGGHNLVQIREVDQIICGIEPYFDEEVEDMSDELMERLADMVATLAAQRSAEYVYGDEDKNRDLNMYNAAHWAYNIGLENRTRLDRVEAKMDAIMRHLRIEQ